MVWLIFYAAWKNDIPGLNNISKYATIQSFLKYIVNIISLDAGIYLGNYLSSAKYKNNLNVNNIFSKNVRYITKNLSNINIFILIIIHLYLILYIINNNLYSLIKTSGLQVLSYSTTHNKENYWRIFLNLLIVESYIESDLFFNIHSKYTKYKLLTVIILSLFDGIFLAERTLLIIVLIVIITIYVQSKLGFNYKLKLAIIVKYLIIIFIIIVASEIFRFGIINSVEKRIKLFSLANIFDIIKYLTVAYLGKNFNNAMIILDSTPTYNFFSTGSQVLMAFINLFKKTEIFVPVINIGPYGTVDMTALIWLDFGVLSFFILSLIGFIIGFAYNKFINNSSILSNFTYSLIVPGIILSIRINYFFSNYFIIPMIYILIIKYIYFIIKKQKIYYENK